MILFSEDSMGRSYIKKNLVIRKLYEYLKEENENLNILSIKSEENKVMIYLNGSKELYNSDLIDLQKKIITFLKGFFNLNVFEVDIEIV